jgi:hypothetical protein
VLVGVAGAAAEVENGGAEGLAGAVEGAAGKALFLGGTDDGSGPDGLAGGGEKVEEPGGAEVELGGRRDGVDIRFVVKCGDGAVAALEGEGEGRWRGAEVGLDDLKAAEVGGAGLAEGHDGAGGGDEVGGAAEVAGGDAGAGGAVLPFAEVVDEEQGEAAVAGDVGEEAEEVAGALQAGLSGGDSRGQGVDDDEGGVDLLAHFDEAVPLVKA